MYTIKQKHARVNTADFISMVAVISMYADYGCYRNAVTVIRNRDTINFGLTISFYGFEATSITVAISEGCNF